MAMDITDYAPWAASMPPHIAADAVTLSLAPSTNFFRGEVSLDSVIRTPAGSVPQGYLQLLRPPSPVSQPTLNPKDPHIRHYRNENQKTYDDSAEHPKDGLQVHMIR